MSSDNLRVIVSLHDVAPAHLPRLRRAEELFQKLGVEKIQYLLVPDFHGDGATGEGRASASPEFIAWCARPRPFAVSWWLHGYFHLDRAMDAEASPLGAADRFKRRFLTAGEGEFLALTSEEAGRRLDLGLEEFSRCLAGARPDGFVAPAWLFRPEVLLPALAARKLPFTEDHHRIYNVAAGTSLPSPVITWATRTLLYKYLSLAVCPARAWWFRRDTILRVAMHPHDFDHPETVASIESLLRRTLQKRSQAFPSRLDWEGVVSA